MKPRTRVTVYLTVEDDFDYRIVEGCAVFDLSHNMFMYLGADQAESLGASLLAAATELRLKKEAAA